jgi:Rieske Fe-S protein
MKDHSKPVAPPQASEIGTLPRRGFMRRALAFGIGSLIGFVPLSAAVVFFLDPLTRKKRAVGMTGDAIDEDGFIRVAPANALAADGSPRSFKVIADVQDFWNKFPESEVGSVYLSRDPTSQDVVCFNTRCPHLGCTVKYQAEQQHFECPCHESAFSLDGKRTNNVPPRDMDPLETKVDEQGMIWVKYQKYRAGVKDRVPV